MSFAEGQQRLQRYFIERGLQGWGDTIQPTNQDLLIFDVTNIFSVLKQTKEKIDNNPEISRWKEAVLQLRQSQQRIEEREYIRWMVRVYEDYLLRIYDKKYIHHMLFNTIQKLGAFLSDPQATHIKHLTIQTILRSLEIMEEILQPVRDFTDLREAYSLIRTNFRYFMREPWNYQYHDELNKTLLVRNTTINQRDLEQVFREENWRGWGSQGQVNEQMFQELDKFHQGITNIFNAFCYPRFREWWQQMDRIRIEPDGLHTQDQLICIREDFWVHLHPFHRLRVYWSRFIEVIEKCAPNLSQPIYGFDMQKLRRIQSALRTIGMYRILVQPFIMVIKGLPFILSGDLPETVDFDSDQ